MSKKLIKFNNKEYEIDESEFTSAKAEIENHLLYVMNGSGAVIKLGDSSYNVDSNKLTMARNNFTSHLGTMEGEGGKVVVNNVAYSVDSTKLTSRVTEIEGVLANWNSNGEESSDFLMLAWNSEYVVRDVSVMCGDQPVIKISDFIPTADDFTETELVETLEDEEYFYPLVDLNDNIDNLIIVNYDGIMMISVAKAGEYDGVVFPETGLYVTDLGYWWAEDDVLWNSDFVISRAIPFLEIPQLSLTGQILTITPVENAIEYEIYVANELVYTTTETTIDLSEQLLSLNSGCYIHVKAIPSEGYRLSESGINYELPRLATPDFSLDGHILTISPVENATQYKLLVNDEVYTTTETTIDLLSAFNNDGGYYLNVCAISPGKYLDSYSARIWVDVVAGDYLVFSSPNTFTLKIKDNTKYWNGTLEYSTDRSTWNEWNGTSAINSSSEGKLYMRGTGNTYITGSSAASYKANWVFLGSNISCNGNIENLLDYQTVMNGEHPIMDDYCYYYMFHNCAILKRAPELPATTLSNNCYGYMFYGCQNLVGASAPELPATTLSNECYRGMFGSTRLTTAPELPATTLAEGCYRSMFYQAQSLTTAPELPATILADSCYKEMFYNCTALTTAPMLPATTLADGCYSGMFNGCTALTTAPELPATTLADACYINMFAHCTALTTAPELPATTLAKQCYSYMFGDCQNLTRAPELPATTLAERCYSNMFAECINLTTLPTLPATTLAKQCYYYMFDECKNIKISATQTDEYQNAYRVPISGEGTTAEYALQYMFRNIGSTCTMHPSINTTYYTSNEII